MIKVPRNHILTGLDVGTKTTRVLIAQKRPGTLKLQTLGQGEAPSSGMIKGAVVNPEKTQDSIRAALEKAERAFGRRVDSVFANVGGDRIFVTSSHGLISVSRADRRISEEDVKRVLQAAQTFSLPSNREILDVFPKEFIVDGEGKIKEPLEMEGVRLETEALILCAFSPYLKKLTKAVVDSGLSIEKFFFTPLASAKSVLSQRDKELGVALLDMGAGTTGFCVFEEGTLLHLAIFPVGSLNITNDIATILRCDIDTAERIKLNWGSCILEKKKKKEVPEEKPLGFSQKKLVSIIEARVSEILDLVQQELKKISRQRKLPAGVVLAGGGAKLPGIVELTKKRMKLPCRIGVPRGFYPPLEDPSWAAVSGLVLKGAEISDLETSGFSKFLKRIFRIFIP